jgi:hypothetical protein
MWHAGRLVRGPVQSWIVAGMLKVWAMSITRRDSLMPPLQVGSTMQ